MVIIIPNHAIVEPDARATWGRSQVLEGDGRGDDNLKRGRLGIEGEKEREWGGLREGQPSPDPATPPLHSEEVLLTSTPTLGQQPSAKTPNSSPTGLLGL